MQLVWEKLRTSCWSFDHPDKPLPLSVLGFSSVVCQQSLEVSSRLFQSRLRDVSDFFSSLLQPMAVPRAKAILTVFETFTHSFIYRINHSFIHSANVHLAATLCLALYSMLWTQR